MSSFCQKANVLTNIYKYIEVMEEYQPRVRFNAKSDCLSNKVISSKWIGSQFSIRHQQKIEGKAACADHRSIKTSGLQSSLFD
jgi:hypothetical protein